VALVYFDASALMKLLLDEEGTELATLLWDGCDAAVSSRLAYPEVCAALAAAHRARLIRAPELAASTALWDELWSEVRPVELSPSLARSAGRLAADRQLRGADAVHLASALAVGDPDLVVAVWDRRLRAGAVAEHLIVAPQGDVE
jgi:predicted nucleic acid-binding protein